MERLKSIKEQLVSCVQGQMGNLDKVNTKELGEAIDMIKDLAETMYYCAVYEAMEENKQEGKENNNYYYMEKYLPYEREADYARGRMYYDGNNSSSSNGNSSSTGGQSSGGRNYYEEMYPISWKDDREGKSGQYRKMYMESKQMHQDQNKKIQELENYMKELTNDITEMIQDASPEEKAVLQRKMNTLSNKIQNV